MSGRDNLRTMASALGGIPDGHIDTILDVVGLADRQKDRVRTYSLGMKQRLGVAMALLHNPDLLILDEPANGLDPAGIVEMRDLMRALAAQGKTVFISSHVLTEVQQICTRVAIINNGRLVTESTVEALTQTEGVYAVKVREPAEALALVKAQPWGASAQIDANGYLLTASPDGEGRSLNLFLSQAGHAPDLIMYQEREPGRCLPALDWLGSQWSARRHYDTDRRRAMTTADTATTQTSPRLAPALRRTGRHSSAWSGRSWARSSAGARSGSRCSASAC